MLCNVARLLTDGGVYTVISFRQRELLEPLLSCPELPWTVERCDTLPASSTTTSTARANLCVMRKDRAAGGDRDEATLAAVQRHLNQVMDRWCPRRSSSNRPRPSTDLPLAFHRPSTELHGPRLSFHGLSLTFHGCHRTSTVFHRYTEEAPLLYLPWRLEPTSHMAALAALPSSHMAAAWPRSRMAAAWPRSRMASLAYGFARLEPPSHRGRTCLQLRWPACRVPAWCRTAERELALRES